MTTDTTDPHAGQGGSYMLDPATGQRVLVERTAEAGEQPAPTTTTETPAAAPAAEE